MRSRILFAIAALAALALSACNSTEATLHPSAGAGRPAEAASPEPMEAGASASSLTTEMATDPAAASQAPADSQSATLTPAARIQFAPIVGATVEAITPLMRGLSERAAQRGIALLGSGDADATHLMKGYFSTIEDEGKTTVIFVWDVLDTAGNRLHRIQGQEPVAGAANEGWPGVPGGTMEAIGSRTVDEFAAWLSADAD